MLIANAPITGQRKNGLLLPRDTFKDELLATLKPLEKECGCELPECICFADHDLRRIAFRKRLGRLGIPYEEISTHSYRKGSASNAASGSTHAPPIVAICLRAGWKLSGVLNTYLVLENAGDNFVGRVASNLPLLQKGFGVLPPSFPRELADAAEGLSAADKMETAMSGMFGDYERFGGSFAAVLRHCLASLCYHRRWLSNLPASHPVHATYLAMNPGVWAELQTMVGALRYNGDDIHCRL